MGCLVVGTGDKVFKLHLCHWKRTRGWQGEGGLSINNLFSIYLYVQFFSMMNKSKYYMLITRNFNSASIIMKTVTHKETCTRIYFVMMNKSNYYIST